MIQDKQDEIASLQQKIETSEERNNKLEASQEVLIQQIKDLEQDNLQLNEVLEEALNQI